MSNWKEQEISEEDEEFLRDIEMLSEAKKNGIIAYIKNREKTLQAEVERLKKENERVQERCKTNEQRKNKQKKTELLFKFFYRFNT